MSEWIGISILMLSIFALGYLCGRVICALCRPSEQSEISHELAEVVHGEWKFIGDSEEPYDCAWMCSVCGKMYWVEDSNMVTEDAHYCPNCGARMDKR